VPERNSIFKIKMPGANPILRHWQKECAVLHNNLVRLRAEMNVEAIHDLRVAIKKIRSYRKLHAALFDKKEPGKAQVIRELFSILGRHRNIDIAKTLLISFSDKKKPPLNSMLVYLQLLQDQIAPFCKKTIEEFSEEPIEKWTDELHKDIESFTSDQVTIRARKVMAASVKTVKHDLKHFKKNSHLVRKSLKDIFYWSNIFEEDIFFTKQQVKSLDKILDHLGSVQDHEVLITNLKNFRKTILTDSLQEYDRVKKMELNAEKKKNGLLEKANNMTEKLLSEPKAPQTSAAPPQ
jgi:CHAD domain-containing protein